MLPSYNTTLGYGQEIVWIACNPVILFSQLASSPISRTVTAYAFSSARLVVSNNV